MKQSNISFDIDGILANFVRGFTRKAHAIFGTPVCDVSAQTHWMFEDFAELGLTKDMCKVIWANIEVDPLFWENLDPFNVSAMDRINAIQNKVFITNRLGVDPKGQSERFLEKWGVKNPKVLVAAKKGPVAVEQFVLAHIDDYYPNCTDIRTAVPECYTALLTLPYNVCYHAEWKSAHTGEIVMSLDQFIDECDRRCLTVY